MRDRIDILQFDNFVGQQPKRPAGIPFRRFTATKCDQAGFKITVCFLLVDAIAFASRKGCSGRKERQRANPFSCSIGVLPISQLEGQRTSNQFLDEPVTPGLDRLEDTLYECEAVLVEEPLFEEFNDEFTAYVSGTGKAFDVAEEDEAGAYPIVEATYVSAVALVYLCSGGPHP